MTKDYQERSLLDFHKEFLTEEACQKHLLSIRWSEGVCLSELQQYWVLVNLDTSTPDMQEM